MWMRETLLSYWCSSLSLVLINSCIILVPCLQERVGLLFLTRSLVTSKFICCEHCFFVVFLSAFMCRHFFLPWCTVNFISSINGTVSFCHVFTLFICLVCLQLPWSSSPPLSSTRISESSWMVSTSLPRARFPKSKHAIKRWRQSICLCVTCEGFCLVVLALGSCSSVGKCVEAFFFYRPISSQTFCTVATAPGAALVGRKQLSFADRMAFWLTSVVHRERFRLNGVFVQRFQAQSGQAFFLEECRLWEKTFAALLGRG